MLSKFWFWGAVLWTVFVTVICLIRFPDVPNVGISGADKYVHALIHLIFTVFWALHFRFNKNLSALQSGIIVFTMSALFGAAIEIAQNYFTETRMGDGNDIIANCVGSAIGLALLALYHAVTSKPN